ncbi:MAG: [acyl-carrier-protein] S-malonyltransferase [Bacteroidetes bacterium MED-G17]|nr:MAG: [acyl-carrier-protein] S-malonyltransferase [Bacteroidetes bacterium TMED39]PDH51972.1 MAG: [acyl-carrier-protein] S-malonyltransferase [Bacteroidetes bacterium MED-G17]CAI8270663.1 MAG: Malonyl CoA-acyl carrier protein transacylase [Bacteroidetes bacterium MED-G17]|tara:strand:+ start:6802 stop:7680 length:879 start_codon:yes stop_codon:yes gene_type:complete
MTVAYVFPGQGAQFVGMGYPLYEQFEKAKIIFEEANDILGFNITDIMFNGNDEDLKQTKVTQPAIFLHSVVRTQLLKNFEGIMTAGHSLGEYSALVAAKVLNWQDALKLVSARAQAMQKACENQPGTMAAIIGLENKIIEGVCEDINGIVVPANYNTEGQLVISGEVDAVKKACTKLTEHGAKRALLLNVGGAFHSPIMASAADELKSTIEKISFQSAAIKIFQNVTAMSYTDANQIKNNLIDQLTGPVKWAQTIKNMLDNGVTKFVEIGPGRALQGMIKKIDRSTDTEGLS